MRNPRNHTSHCMLQPQYGTRSRDRKNVKNDCRGIITCPQEGKLQEVHSRTVKINDLGSCVANGNNGVLGVNNSDNMHNIEKSPPLLCKNGKVDLQITRESGRLSVKNIEDLQDMSESNEKGIKCKPNSQIKDADRNKLCSPVEIILANAPQIQNINATCEWAMDKQNIRKSKRLSGKSREGNLKLLFEGSVPQFQNMCSDYDQEMDMQTIQKSPRLSRNRETDLESNMGCGDEGIKHGTESQKRGSEWNNLSAVELVDKPQVQNLSMNSNVQIKLKSTRKSPRFSGVKRLVDMKSTSQCSKEVKLGAGSLRKGSDGFSLPNDVELTSAPSAQNESAESDEKEGKFGAKSPKKSSHRKDKCLPVEVELTNPSLLNRSAKSDAFMVEKAIASPRNSSKSVPTYEYYVSSGKGINLIVDLNSSQSDWTGKILEHVTLSTSQTLQKKKFESFRHEIECLRSKKMISSLVSTSISISEINLSHVQIDVSPKSVGRENCFVGCDIPDGGNGTSESTMTSSCIEVRTGDGGQDSSSKVDFETFGDRISTCEELLEMRVPASGTEASDHLQRRPVKTESSGSHKRKNRSEIDGMLLKSGKRLGSRRSMRLSYKGGQ